MDDFVANSVPLHQFQERLRKKTADLSWAESLLSAIERYGNAREKLGGMRSQNLSLCDEHDRALGLVLAAIASRLDPK